MHLSESHGTVRNDTKQSWQCHAMSSKADKPGANNNTRVTCPFYIVDSSFGMQGPSFVFFVFFGLFVKSHGVPRGAGEPL